MSIVQPEPWDQLARRVAAWIEDDPDAQTRGQLSALLATGVDVGHHAVALLGGHERPELGVGIQARPETRCLRVLGQRPHDLVEALGGHEQP